LQNADNNHQRQKFVLSPKFEKVSCKKLGFFHQPELAKPND
jgi:hypothetical protein